MKINPMPERFVSPGAFQPLSWVLFFSIALYPVYTFSSGNPQVSDFVFLVFAFFLSLSLLKDGCFYIEKSYHLPIMLVWIFFFWVFVVNFYWSVQGADFADQNLHILYSAIYFTVILVAASSKKIDFKEVVFYGVVTAIAIAFVGSLFVGQGVLRSSATFNNPNQLAYFILLAVSMMTLARFRLPKNSLLEIAVVGIATWLAFISGSLTVWALMGCVITHFAIFRISIGLKHIPLVSIAILSYLLILLLNSSLSSDFLIAGFVDIDGIHHLYETRIGTLDTKINNVEEERGYDRIIHNPQYIAFGAGVMSDFWFNGMEIHSTPGALIFYYGVVGFALFVVICFFPTLPYGAYKVSLFPMLVVWAYTMTHIGFRATYFWLFIALLYFICKERSKHDSINWLIIKEEG